MPIIMKPLIFVVLIAIIRTSHSLAVMSVDIGSEWMKVAIVSPGVPMEIALNKESKRKTPAVISFRDNVRSFGEDAQTLGLRFPQNSYTYLLDLLGKNISHPLVQLYQQRFPHYEIIEDNEHNSILFRYDGDHFSVEELMGQLLGQAKEMAEQSAHQSIKEAVITVPGYFSQVERKAMLQAAKLANLKVLQLVNDYVAVALNYGIFRIKDFNETAQYVMFYDMGASSTTATLVSYQTLKTKERGYVETHPQLSVIGVGFDRTLGGLEIQLRLRDFLGKKFNEMKKTKNDVFKNPRAMAKLFKEAGRLKNVLSANNEHYAQIENLLDDQDFKCPVKREDLEALISDLLDRVPKPIEQALKTAHLTKDIVNQVVLVGAGTRVPKIQEILQNTVGQELRKNLNTDEAATMGAVYKAADLSTGFQVKKFITKDAVLYPIQIVFERQVDKQVKQVKRTLFGLMNPYPQKKIITFNKHTTDFDFNINYAELDYLPTDEVTNIGQLNISRINVIGVEEALKKNTGDNIETKGIKAHFALDESGILNLVNVELIVEKTVTETEEEGTLSKLGNTISKLFGGEEKATEEAKIEEPKEPVKNETEAKNATTEQKPSKEVKPKILVHKEPIKAIESFPNKYLLNETEMKSSLEKLARLDKIEKEINRRATALNNLESFVIDVQNKLYEDLYIEASTTDELETIKTTCTEIAVWIYEDGSEADADTYENKLEMLKKLTHDLFARVWEHKERPEALGALTSMLNHSRSFLATARNLTKNQEKDVFTEAEVDALEKIIKETTDWQQKTTEEQGKLKSNESVKLTVRSITDKMAALDREVKYLINKIKMWRPKKVEKPNKTEDKSETVEKPVREEAVKDEDGTVTNEEDEQGEAPVVEEQNKESDSESHNEL